MPFQSQQQAKAMFSAAAGNSNIGIPKKVGQEFVNASKGEKVSTLPQEIDNLGQGKKKKTHRGRRSKGKGPMTPAAHHAEAKDHLANAQAAKTPQASTAHLFKALTSLNKAKAGTVPKQQTASGNDADNDADEYGGAPDQD